MKLSRFSHVTRDMDSSATDAKASGFRVEAPRASDAIGLALRDAFDRDLGLPDDMMAILCRLNGGSPRPSH